MMAQLEIGEEVLPKAAKAILDMCSDKKPTE
jgi:hypothetical protein